MENYGNQNDSSEWDIFANLLSIGVSECREGTGNRYQDESAYSGCGFPLSYNQCHSSPTSSSDSFDNGSGYATELICTVNNTSMQGHQVVNAKNGDTNICHAYPCVIGLDNYFNNETALDQRGFSPVWDQFSHHCEHETSTRNVSCEKHKDAYKHKFRSVPDPNRNGATERERSRMHVLNAAFDELRRVVPRTNLGEHQRLSKIATLRLAIHYISALVSTLRNSGIEIRQIKNTGVGDGRGKRKKTRKQRYIIN
ncbi:hypothetical protein CHS0354_028333 [Potamilus streckersoni]|uniref:BHLH domain-containing protein n=1 Tax=Potamilus streckersoni TaxID=2493646 RepID=A0AAE0RTS1_9BIVA|nr:hypothetical protein CHS0354_028333 [Potamilus streckersoni]